MTPNEAAARTQDIRDTRANGDEGTIEDWWRRDRAYWLSMVGDLRSAVGECDHHLEDCPSVRDCRWHDPDGAIQRAEREIARGP